VQTCPSIPHTNQCRAAHQSLTPDLLINPSHQPVQSCSSIPHINQCRPVLWASFTPQKCATIAPSDDLFGSRWLRS